MNRLRKFSVRNPIIGEIVRPLARHYGLRPAGEELNFIINYDVKYHLGVSAGEEE